MTHQFTTWATIAQEFLTIEELTPQDKLYSEWVVNFSHSCLKL